MIEIIPTDSTDPAKADLHLHTIGSDGKLTPKQTVDQAIDKGLDVIAITDHDNPESSLEARDYAGDKIIVLPGAERTVDFRRHVLAIFPNSYSGPLTLTKGKPLDWTIIDTHELGGKVYVPHPFSRFTTSLGEKAIFFVLNHPDPRVYFDGLEVFNGALADNPFSHSNKKALSFYLSYRQYLGTPIGGTDNHGSNLGRVLTTYPRELTIQQALATGRTGVIFTGETDTPPIRELIPEALFNWFIRPLKDSLKRSLPKESPAQPPNIY